MQTLIIVALALSAALNVYQAASRRAMSRDWSWGIRSQGSWYWRLPFEAFFAWLWPVSIVHLDIDNLKTLNRVMGEARVNELLHKALRKSDLARSQNGDECFALVRRLPAHQVADRILGRLAALPLTTEERSALGGHISATVVIAGPTRHLLSTLPRLVARREQMKAQGQRGKVQAL